jgi:thymidine phosphorylase
VQPDIATFRKVVREVGCAVIGQTDDLAPADRRLYATRDVTATVESIPLMVSSILSKKVAEGLDGLVMDVKCGSGAFCDTEEMARDLAESLVAVANQAGLPTVALITDMDRVLGRNVGNALEIVETVEYLKGEDTRDPRLHEVTMALAGEMVALGGLAPDAAAGRAKAEAALADGRAAEVFARMVGALGGPDDFLEHSARYLGHASVIRPCHAERSGYVAGMDARQVGIAVVALGGGRSHADDAIDPSVGLTDVVDVGTAVRAGSLLCVVHAASDADADQAIEIVQRAIASRTHAGRTADDHRPDRPVTPDLDAYRRDGFLVLPGFLPSPDCDALQARAAELVAAFDPGWCETVFSARDQGHARDAYFRESVAPSASSSRRRRRTSPWRGP